MNYDPEPEIFLELDDILVIKILIFFVLKGRYIRAPPTG